MPELLPGTEVEARGLRWELVHTQNLGAQVLHRLRGIDGHFEGQEIDLLAPFENIIPIARTLLHLAFEAQRLHGCGVQGHTRSSPGPFSDHPERGSGDSGKPPPASEFGQSSPLDCKFEFERS